MRICLRCLTVRAKLYTSDAKMEIYWNILVIKSTPTGFIQWNIKILRPNYDPRDHLLEIGRNKCPIIGGLIS
jgi:hypothetical protein